LRIVSALHLLQHLIQKPEHLLHTEGELAEILPHLGELAEVLPTSLVGLLPASALLRGT
jgi:hypothetical protein